MIQGIGGEWKGEDLDAAGRLYQLRFCPEADQGLWCLPSRGRRIVYLLGEGSIWSFRRDSSDAAVKVQRRLQVTAAEGVRAAVLAHVGLTIASEWMLGCRA